MGVDSYLKCEHYVNKSMIVLTIYIYLHLFPN